MTLKHRKWRRSAEEDVTQAKAVSKYHIENPLWSERKSLNKIRFNPYIVQLNKCPIICLMSYYLFDVILIICLMSDYFFVF